MALTRRGGGAARRGIARGPSVPGIETYWLRSFLGIALVLLAAAILSLVLSSVRETADARHRLARDAGILARAASSELGSIRRRLDALRSDAFLRDAFASGDPARLEAAKTALADRLPGALSVNLFAPEETSAVETIPYMRWAGLDLARQATSDGETTALEVHKVGQPEMHLAIAAPVLSQDGSRTIGVVHLALPMSFLPDYSGAAGAGGVLRFRQAVRNDAPPVDGGGPTPEREPDHIEAVPDTRLQVAAWVMRDSLVDPWLAGQVAGVYLLVLALVGGVLWLSYRGLRSDLLKECDALKTMVDDAVNGRPPHELQTRLAELQAGRSAVAGLLRQLRTGQGIALGATDASQGSDPSSASAPSANALEGGAAARADSSPSNLEKIEVPAEIFRAYDIRGIADRQLSRELMQRIGRAIGSEAAARGDRRVVVGRDCRASSPRLCTALTDGIRAAGLDVLDLGVVPTPLVYFAACHPERHAGAMVTGSHNPPEYNGVKPVLAGESADEAIVQALRTRIERGDLASGSGAYRAEDIVPAYREYLEWDVALARGFKVVLDCGNATASVVAPELFRALGCEVVELNCDMNDGMVEPVLDPSNPELMRDLARTVLDQHADIGLAFDGDGDRLGVVDSEGQFVAADRVLMLLAADMLSRHPGSDVIFDVKCSRHLAAEVRRAGGRPIMWRSGHAPLKAKLRESGALLAGELSGHIMLKERWFGFDDAIYVGARLLEVLSLDPRSSHEVLSALPCGLATPELSLPLREGESFQIMQRVMELADRLEGMDVIRVDGLRVEHERGWGLVRASNTQPRLTFRFEGDDRRDLEQIQSLFRRLMDKAAPGLALPF